MLEPVNFSLNDAHCTEFPSELSTVGALLAYEQGISNSRYKVIIYYLQASIFIIIQYRITINLKRFRALEIMHLKLTYPVWKCLRQTFERMLLRWDIIFTFMSYRCLRIIFQLSESSLRVLESMDKEWARCRDTSDLIPSQAWNIEMLEAVNFAAVKASQKQQTKKYFEIFLFHEYEGRMYLVNTRPSYFENEFTSINRSVPIYLLKDPTGTFKAMHPKSREVSIVAHVFITFLIFCDSVQRNVSAYWSPRAR